MDVGTIPAVRGARHRKKRVGRGIGSGHGKTATRGQKGQRARTGEGKRPGFEGGRNPLIRRLPKRGFRQKATGRPQPAQIVNVAALERCAAGERITPERLEALGLIRSSTGRVKLLGDGTLSKRLTVAVHQVSGSAKTKVEQAGGTVELLTTAQGSGLRAQGSGQTRPQPPAPSPQPPA
jgi:large subunit ribosomal protein L15